MFCFAIGTYMLDTPLQVQYNLTLYFGQYNFSSLTLLGQWDPVAKKPSVTIQSMGPVIICVDASLVLQHVELKVRIPFPPFFPPREPCVPTHTGISGADNAPCWCF